jgi:hypothetical protein
MEKSVTIYALVDPRTDQVRYIGQTVQPLEYRLWSHLHVAARRKVDTPKVRWLQELQAAGLKPSIIALEVVTHQDRKQAEGKWIQHFSDGSLTNSAPPGAGGTHSHLGIWTPEVDKRLGKESDEAIALDLGVTRKAVAYRRRKLKIPSFTGQKRVAPPPMGGWNRVALPDDIINKLGTMPDYKLAEEAGVSKKRIMRERQERRIPSYSEEEGHPTRYKQGHRPTRWKKGGEP